MMLRKLTCIAALVACEPLVGEDYLGTPSFAIGGQIARPEVGPMALDDANLRLSLFWIGLDSRNEARPRIEQRAVLEDGLASFRMILFGAPPEEALTRNLSLPIEPGIGVALIVLYADQNGNEILNSYEPAIQGPDTILGASASHLVVYNEAPIEDGDAAAELFGVVPPGYHLYENATRDTCAFAGARRCRGAGLLVRVADLDRASIVLTLYPSAAEVLVPNPRVPGSSSTEPDSSIYSIDRGG